MSKPFKRSLSIIQGATFDDTVTWRTGTPLADVDLTGCSARMHVRSELASPVVLLDLTTVNGGIVLGGVAGTVTIHIPALDTAAITWTEGVYDLEIIFADGVTVRRLVEGSVNVLPEVTR